MCGDGCDRGGDKYDGTLISGDGCDGGDFECEVIR